MNPGVPIRRRRLSRLDRPGNVANPGNVIDLGNLGSCHLAVARVAPVARVARVDCPIGASSLSDLGGAPVHDEHLPERADHDVRRREVAVHDAVRVSERDGIGHAREQPEPLRQRRRSWVPVRRAGCRARASSRRRRGRRAGRLRRAPARCPDAPAVPARRASVRSRATLAPSARPLRTFKATWRSSSRSRTQYTRPMPPRPSGAMSSYRVPLRSGRSATSCR